MRVIAATILAFLPQAAAATPPQALPATVPPNGEIQVPLDSFDRMNFFSDARGCKSILRQVAGDHRRNGTRLDRLPPGRTILAVDRQVNGCHEVAFLSEERRR